MIFFIVKYVMKPDNKFDEFVELSKKKVGAGKIAEAKVVLDLINEEVINTPLGAFNATAVERVRNDEGRSTVFWLANDWQFVLIRMEQTDSGLTIVLELNEGTVEGTAMVPLN